MTQPSRALLIGLDSAVPGRWRKYAEAGLLPVGQRLLAEGCFAARCLPALPTLTTTNWATIATGSWPGTHGVTDFNPHRPGDIPDSSPQGFDARAVRAEFIWEAAARAGRDSIVVNWPGSWPPRDAPDGGAGKTATRPPRAADAPAPGRVIMVGGAGIELNEWRIGLSGKARLVALAAEQRFSTQDEPGAAHVTLPPDGRPFELPFRFRESYDAVRPGLSLRCRVLAGPAGPVARFSLPGRAEALAELAEGEWSERLTLPFEVNGSTTAGAFRLKLLALDPAAGLFRLYVTDICRLGWLEHPSGVLGDTAGFAGLPTPGVGWDSLGSGGHRPGHVRRPHGHGDGVARGRVRVAPTGASLRPVLRALPRHRFLLPPLFGRAGQMPDPGRGRAAAVRGGGAGRLPPARRRFVHPHRRGR